MRNIDTHTTQNLYATCIHVICKTILNICKPFNEISLTKITKKSEIGETNRSKDE